MGFSRLNQFRFLKRDPMLTGILEVAALPPQSTFWRFLASLHLGIARQLQRVQDRMRERVREAANLQLEKVTIDTDTSVHTLFGHQMGARKGYKPKNRGKKSYQPILSFIAETREIAAGELRTGYRPDGKEIAAHLDAVEKSLPKGVKRVYARADSGFYCRQAIEAYEKKGWKYIVVARKTARLRFLFLAARIWRHAGRVGISYSDHYQEKHVFQRLMERLRRMVRGRDGFAPVLSRLLST